jgi:hypothetical protein
MKSPQQLSQEIIDIIKATGNYFVGNTSGMSNDGTVNVYHPKGYSISAIAANPISSGEVIVFKVNDIWYAFGEQRTVVKQDILIQRKSRAIVDNYYVTVLYSIKNDTINNLYIGGDRNKQLLNILELENTVTKGFITNLGSKKYSCDAIIFGNNINNIFHKSRSFKTLLNNTTEVFNAKRLTFVGNGIWVGQPISSRGENNDVEEDDPIINRVNIPGTTNIVPDPESIINGNEFYGLYTYYVNGSGLNEAETNNSTIINTDNLFSGISFQSTSQRVEFESQISSRVFRMFGDGDNSGQGGVDIIIETISSETSSYYSTNITKISSGQTKQFIINKGIESNSSYTFNSNYSFLYISDSPANQPSITSTTVTNTRLLTGLNPLLNTTYNSNRSNNGNNITSSSAANHSSSNILFNGINARIVEKIDTQTTDSGSLVQVNELPITYYADITKNDITTKLDLTLSNTLMMINNSSTINNSSLVKDQIISLSSIIQAYGEGSAFPAYPNTYDLLSKLLELEGVDVLFAKPKDSKSTYLVKATINNVTKYQSIFNQSIFTVDLLINNVKIVPYVSFDRAQGAFILDDGSINTFLQIHNTASTYRHKDSLAAITGGATSFSTFNDDFFSGGGSIWNDSTKYNFIKNMNLTEKNIYITKLNTLKKEAYVEIWDVTENGLIKYNKVITTDLLPIPAAANILSCSYHPKA